MDILVFLGGPVVKNLSANAGDTGLIPGPGRSHKLRSNFWACTLETESYNYWSLCALGPMCHKRNHHNEKPMDHNEQRPPLASTRESPHAAMKTQHSQKCKIKSWHTMWLHVYDILEKEKLWAREQTSGYQGLGVGEVWVQRVRRRNSLEVFIYSISCCWEGLQVI